MEPATDVATVTNSELTRRFPDGAEAWTVRRCREWCARNCSSKVWIKWHLDDGYFGPTAYFADRDDAAKFAIHCR
jgi:hypothetical protein